MSLESRFTLPDALHAKLRKVSNRMKAVGIITALAYALLVLLLAMLAAMLVDYLAVLRNSPWRVALTGTTIAAACFAFAWAFTVAWRRAFSPVQVSLEIDRQVPQLEERYSTVAAYASGNIQPQFAHPAFLRRVACEAEVGAAQIEPTKIVRFTSLAGISAALSAAVLLGILGGMFCWPYTSILLRRFWSPTANISATQLAADPGDIVVAFGDSLSIAARQSGIRVHHAQLLLEQHDGLQTLTLIPDVEKKQEFLHNFKSVERDFAYFFRAGDGLTAWHRVTVAERPTIESVRVTITPPAYRPESVQQFDHLPHQCSCLTGSRLELAIKPKAALKSLELQFDNDRKTSLSSAADGWYRWRTELTESISLSPLLTEPHGLMNHHPPVMKIETYTDKPPTVNVVRPNDEIAVQPNDKIEIEFVAEDDGGIGEAELIVTREPAEPGKPAVRIAVPIELGNAAGKTKIESKTTLDLSKFPLADGEKVTYQVRVTEFRADGSMPTSVASQPAAQSTTAKSQPTAVANSKPANDAKPTDNASETPANAGTPPQAPPLSAIPPASPPNQPVLMAVSSDYPGDTMPRRRLDVPQSGVSQVMRIKVDEWAGSFAGQQRVKLEMAIAPDLSEMQRYLQEAQTLSREVLDELQNSKEWKDRHQKDITAAEEAIKQAQTVAVALHQRSLDTPYAFMGLQVIDISEAHLIPARRALRQSLATNDKQREDATRVGWDHICRALERMAKLTQRFETVRQDFALADKTERIKKMYRVFQENSFALLGVKPAEQSKFQRKPIEFEYSQEYLDRYQEVLELRQKMMSELAKLLAEDPRLRRRFMNNFRNQTDSLRLQLTKLRDRQQKLNQETELWFKTDAVNRGDAQQILARSRVEEASQIARAASQMADRFETWLPKDNLKEGNAELKRLNDEAQLLSVLAREMAVSAARVQPTSARSSQLHSLAQQAHDFAKQVRQLEWQLYQIDPTQLPEGFLAFIVNRLGDTRGLVATAWSWRQRMEALSSGEFTVAAAVEQQELAVNADEIARKLGGLSGEVALATGAADAVNKFNEKHRVLIDTLDQRVTPAQLGAAISLNERDWTKIRSRQIAATEALVEAEQYYDQMIAAAIEEMDKLVPTDPLLELLSDPTLDQLLAQLEQELVRGDLYGIPRRPSNLSVIGDWIRFDLAGMDGNGGLLGTLIMQEQLQLENASNQANDSAMNRVAEQAKAAEAELKDRMKYGPSRRWNRLVSELEDDLLQGRDKQPPEKYRAAIEQFYRIINREVNDQPGVQQIP